EAHQGVKEEEEEVSECESDEEPKEAPKER
ncbi:hypothetical protein A2U01_0069876, partial [Trifolium medium]|nr:hypothetical protein [Trifolium medium]